MFGFEEEMWRLLLLMFSFNMRNASSDPLYLCQPQGPEVKKQNQNGRNEKFNSNAQTFRPLWFIWCLEVGFSFEAGRMIWNITSSASALTKVTLVLWVEASKPTHSDSCQISSGFVCILSEVESFVHFGETLDGRWKGQIRPAGTRSVSPASFIQTCNEQWRRADTAASLSVPVCVSLSWHTVGLFLTDDT